MHPDRPEIREWFAACGERSDLKRLAEIQLDTRERPAVYLAGLREPASSELAESVHKLEANWHEIRNEFLAVQAHLEPHPGAGSVKGNWRSIKLFRSGKLEPGSTLCPFTSQLLSTLPHCGESLGLAYFSVLDGGTDIGPHCGYTNLRIRMHLGLLTPPEPRLFFESGSKSWQEGRCLWFDDGLLHWVEHKGTQQRVVLLVDLWHPDLSAAERQHLAKLVPFL